MKLLILFTMLFMFGCETPYQYKTDKGKICGDIIEERANARYANNFSFIPALDSLFFKCGCDSLK